jgi:hypothetical protein
MAGWQTDLPAVRWPIGQRRDHGAWLDIPSAAALVEVTDSVCGLGGTEALGGRAGKLGRRLDRVRNLACPQDQTGERHHEECPNHARPGGTERDT